MDVSTIFALAGVTTFLLGLIGGGIKVKEVEIPSLPTFTRTVFLVIGVGFIIASMWTSTSTQIGERFNGNQPITPSASPSPSNTPRATQTNSPAPTELVGTPTPLPIESFIDDFTTTPKYWPIDKWGGEYTDSITEIRNGVYHYQMIGKVDNTASTLNSKLPPISDFELEAGINFLDAAESLTFSINFRRTDLGSYYFFIRPKDNQYAFSKYNSQEDKFTDFVDWTLFSGNFVQTNNRFLIRAVGDKIRIYINDILIVDVVDDTYSYGAIRMRTWLDTNELVSLEMSSFKVTLLSP